MKRRIRFALVPLLVAVLVAVTAGADTHYRQSPMLDAAVAAGDLPPVADRLPDSPLVVTPIEEIGTYGGTINLEGVGTSLGADILHVSSPETLLGFDLDGKTVVQSLAESWDYSEDSTVLAVHLREGVRWSDGDPFDADDLLFWYEHVALNEELSPAVPGWLKVGGETLVMEKLDDTTVRYQFAITAPWFANLRSTAYSSSAQGMAFYPAHYMQQFHPAFTDAGDLEKMAKEAGFENWVQLFKSKANYHWAFPTEPDLPTVGSFMLESESVDTLHGTRNPYYWKVDPDGQQLPYIDRLTITLASNNEVYVGKVASGEIDYAQWVVGNDNYPLYAQNLKQNNQEIRLWDHSLQNRVMFFFNLTHPDPVLREIFRDVRFRRAMSLAIDREEIVDVVHIGFGEPRQAAGSSTMTYYNPELDRAYAEHDPDTANSLLDEMGLIDRDADGYRLRPDGKRLSIVLEFWAAGPILTDSAELSSTHWKEVGVEVILRATEIGALSQRGAANEVEMSLVWHGITDASFYGSVPPILVSPSTSWVSFAPLWGKWIAADGADGERPPDEILNNVEIHAQIATTTTREQLAELQEKLLRSQADNLWYIGTAANEAFAVFRANLVNVPPEGTGFIIGNDTEWRGETWFYKS